MGQQTPRQTREGRLIEEAAKASGRSIRSLAANAGISDTRWRQIVKGSQPGPGGEHIQVVAPPLTLAKMANVLGLDSEQLAKIGRTDAANLMADIVLVSPEGDTSFVQLKRSGPPDEIDLIYESSMPARQKLEMIRMVLELRAQAEQEERGAQQKAPTPKDAGAAVEQNN